MKKNFDKHICIGDTVQFKRDGHEFVARIDYDEDSKPSDVDCYDAAQTKAWQNDEWRFAGVVVMPVCHCCGCPLRDRAHSVWAVEINLPGASAECAKHCDELAREMADTLLNEHTQGATWHR